jgi:hypothetical protein
MSEDLEREFRTDRRTFIKRLVIGTAFAAPVVSSFTMSGVQAVFGSTPKLTGAIVPNTAAPPSGPTNYSQGVQCYPYTGALLDVTVMDGAVSLHLTVPAGALPAGTNVCIYKGDLAALQQQVPAGSTALSAYAVVWNSPGDTQPDATSAITLAVTDPAVNSGNTIYMFAKNSSALSSAGTASGHTWTVTFTVDPAYVVTGTAAVSAGPSTVG